MRTRGRPRLGAVLAATLAAAVGSPALAQEPAPLPERPLPPGTPSLPELRPDTSGAGTVAAALAAPRVAIVRDLGPGPAGRLLRDVLAAPHLVVVAPDTGLTLGRDVRVDRPLVVVGDVRIAATVGGDVVALGALTLRPGALVRGRAIAIGGGVYGSSLARVEGEALAYRDLRFASRVEPGGTLALLVRGPETRVRTFTLPGTVGLRIPSYSRIDGLVLGFGPEIRLDTGRVRIEPVATYRSHLGVVDPSVLALAELSRRTRLELRAERATLTNDAWIRGDLLNALLTLGAGVDVRNYYRADRGVLTATRRFETTSQVLEPFLGAQVERAWSAPRDTAPGRSVPLSIVGRDDALEGMRRSNPSVTGGRIASALGGIRWRTEGEQLRGDASVLVEQALATTRADRFTQATFDAQVTFPGFRDHRVDAFAHAVATAGDAPTQRYAYLGGGGTIPSLRLLEQGGLQLVWVESRYTVPVTAVRLPFAGSPNVTLRHIVGGAGARSLPTLTQNLGLRLSISVLRLDYTFDPTGRGDRDFSVGVGFR